MSVMGLKNNLFVVVVKEKEKLIEYNIANTCNIRDLKDCEYVEFTHYIKNLSKIEYSNDGSPKRLKASEEVIHYLDEQLKLLGNNLQNWNVEALELVTEVLRFLRNCTSDFVTQQCILKKTDILNFTDFLFSKIIDTDINSVCLKVLLQFFINLISSNKETGEKIFTLFYDRIKKCFETNVNTYECSALIYYISLIKSITDVELMNMILYHFHNNLENEFLIFFLENSICDESFWNIYCDIKTENKIVILETIKNMQLQKKIYNLPLSAPEILTQEFLKFTGTIFYMSSQEDKLKVSEVSLLLEVLSSLSSDENYLEKLQNDKNILINAGVLLINIHRLGREGNNCFTPVQKLTEFGVNSELNEHPAFGFKADLIRLIGNLCWKNVNMQNLARTAELIPVVLDCCNMDARNPFIIQWSILAVRNICENNHENQKIIAALHQEGVVSSEVLSEMGLTLHGDGKNEVKIIPLESLKKD